MNRIPINTLTKCNVLNRDHYTCVICGFQKINTINDVPEQFKKSFSTFYPFKMEITHNKENKILDFLDNGGDIDDICFNWLSPHGLEIDHITAVCLGGTNIESNLRCLCKKCHRVKTNKDLNTLTSMNHYTGLPFSDVEKTEIKKRLAGFL